MRRRWQAIGLLLAVSAVVWLGCGREGARPLGGPGTPVAQMTPAQLRKQADGAVDRGLKYLHGTMADDGSWGKHPGITGIAVLAFLKSHRDYKESDGPFIRKPLEYLLKMQKTDGGIYDKELANYITSVALEALLAAKNPQYDDAIRKARAYLSGTQLNETQGYKESDPGYGSAGYGGSLRGDLSNVSLRADALHAYEQAGLERDSDDWKRTVVFLQRLQNRSESNPMKWASNDGGVVYSPWESKAGEVTLPDGRKGLRSYGAMTYAFLKTMIYAEVSKDDPRVRAAYDWIRTHYSVDENPELGQQGLFYYYHTMAKALRAWGEDVLVDGNGVEHDWRSDLIRKLVSLQREDGSWVNANDRWWEQNPDLVTAYAILTLEELTAD